MDEDAVKFDAIVVGGGPAGLTAAYLLAKAELEVMLVERGEFAGSKNMGGLLYGTVLKDVIPRFWEQAPIERGVAKRQIFYLGEDNYAGVTVGSQEWTKPPYNYTYTVHRSQFDRWYAQQAEEAGVSLLEGMVVDELAYEGEGAARKAVGVKIRGEESIFYADCIVLCDGANCLVSRGAQEALGMAAGRHEQHYAVGVKETIGLPAGVIEDRFGLEPGEGSASDFIGAPFEGLVGGGFIYTQKETVSIGVAAKLDTVENCGRTPNEIMDAFKAHPAIRRLLRGGELHEYSAHLIPEGGFRSVPQLAANGVLICGDAAGLVNMSLYKEGTNHAMESGRLAAETIVAAKANGDFSRAGLQMYEEKMRDSIAMQDLKKYADFPDILDSTPELLGLYPKKAVQWLVDYFTNDYETKKSLQKKALKKALAGVPKLRALRNFWVARKLM